MEEICLRKKTLYFLCRKNSSTPQKKGCGVVFDDEGFLRLKDDLKNSPLKSQVKLVSTTCQGICPHNRGIVSKMTPEGNSSMYTCSSYDEVVDLIRGENNNG